MEIKRFNNFKINENTPVGITLNDENEEKRKKVSKEDNKYFNKVYKYLKENIDSIEIEEINNIKKIITLEYIIDIPKEGKKITISKKNINTAQIQGQPNFNDIQELDINKENEEKLINFIEKVEKRIEKRKKEQEKLIKKQIEEEKKAKEINDKKRKIEFFDSFSNNNNKEE
jgi:hypothetical protein